jgi:hypothetical protein
MYVRSASPLLDGTPVQRCYGHMPPVAPAAHQARSLAAFLGLAVGDAYGRPLEFVRGDRVRTLPVSLAPGEFRWTDDTHMAMYLARAILDVAPRGGPFDDDAFGHAVAARFVEWSHDPEGSPRFNLIAGTDSAA